MKRLSDCSTIFRFCLIAALGFGLIPVTVSAEEEQGKGEGYLGVYPAELDDAMREALDFEEAGVLVEDVVKGGPADEAGIKAGDIIIELNGVVMFTERRLKRIARRLDPGEKVDVLILRDRKKKTVPLTVGELPEEKLLFHKDDPGAHFKFYDGQPDKKFKMKKMIKDLCCGDLTPKVWIGVKLDKLSEQLGEYFGVSGGEGCLITEVIEDSPAEEAGLKAGDVIVEIEGDEVIKPEDIHKALKEKEPGNEINIGIIRDRKSQTLKVTLGEPPEDCMMGMEEFGEDVRIMVRKVLDDIDIDLEYLKCGEDEEIIILEPDDHPGPGAEGGNLPD